MNLSHGPLPPALVPLGEALVANNAVVKGDIQLGRGVSIWYGSVLRGDCDRLSLGEMTNVQDLSVVHADTGTPNDIGAHVTIGHGAVVHGRRIGDLCLIGIKAVVLGRAEIGDGCIIAAGAVVKEGAIIPPRSLVVGVPGKVVREVTSEQITELQEHAAHYWELALRHRS
jgi:carbonic anhydrase/acetyltransferase-like protein (isoleucine patch superfamily)